MNQKRAKTPQRVHDAEGAAGDASEVQPHKHVSLESSEKAEARARSEARLVRQNQDAELEALEQHRVQLEIEGRKEYYEAKKRASSARTELEPVREASSTPGGSRLAPASGPDRIESAARARMQRHNLSTAGAECRRRHLSAEGDLATLTFTFAGPPLLVDTL
eukprot:COSAG06_NODE_22168_length_732_cov_0.644550_1_plen_162_part_10